MVTDRRGPERTPSIGAMSRSYRARRGGLLMLLGLQRGDDELSFTGDTVALYRLVML